MYFSKEFLTNFIALLLVVISFFMAGFVSNLLFSIGLFALSGSITNQLAIPMLFEKVPFLYGSGVISLRFEAFKESIKALMMREFFTKEQLNEFFNNEEKKIDLAPIIEVTDFSLAFDALSKSVMESSFGSMLGMFGGASMLEGLREPFVKKIKIATLEIVQSDSFNNTLTTHLQNSSLQSDMAGLIEEMIDKKLASLTPLMVKEMVQSIIKEHLSWLVVWGGVFGGIFGVVSALLN